MITLTNPTRRKTPAHIVTVGEHELFFSYETLIAYRGKVSIRRPNDWGPTTGRHFNELGCSNFCMLKGQQFEEAVESLMQKPIIQVGSGNDQD